MQLKKEVRLKKPKFPYLFLKYFVSHFALTLLICLAVVLFVSQYISNSYQKEITSSNIMRAQYAAQTLDKDLMGCHQTAHKISFDEIFLPTRLQSEYGRIEATEALRKYRFPYGLIKEISIVDISEKDNRVLTTLGSFEQKDMLQFCGVPYEQFKVELLKHDGPFFMRRISKDISSDILYIFPKPYAALTNPYAAIIFTLDSKALIQNVKESFADSAEHVCYFTKQGMLLADQNEIAEIKEIWPDLICNEQTALVSPHIDKRHISFIKSYSGIEQIGFVVQLNEDSFLKSVHDLKINLVIFAALLFLAGALGSLMQALRAYTPVKHLFENVMKRTVPEENVNKEFEPVYQAMQDGYVERETLKTKLTTQSKVVSSYYVTNLLYQSKTLQPDVGEMLNFTENCFQVLCVVMDEFGSYCNDDVMVIQNRKLIRELFDRFCTPWCNVYFASPYSPESSEILLNFDSEVDQKAIRNLSSQVQNAFSQKVCNTITVSIGSPVLKIEQIHQSFCQAKNAATYRVISGWNSIIDYQNFNMTISDVQNEIISDDNIINIYLSGDVYQVTKILEASFIHIPQGVTPEMIYSLYHKFINVMAQIVSQRFSDQKNILDSIWTMDQNVPETARVMYEVLIGISARVTGMVHENHGDKNEILARKVMTYIGEHYQEPELSLRVIADEIGVTSSYLSRCFKDYTGNTILQYLDQVRMNLATELLTDSNMTVKSIVGQCGYVDVNNFTRKFKKIYGTTPGAYRERQ